MRAHARIGIAIVALMLGACHGELGAPAGAPERSEPPAAARDAGGGDPSGGSDAGEYEEFDRSRFTTTPGVRRLTRREYAGAIEAVTGLEVDASRAPAELIVEGHARIAGAQRVGYDDQELYFDLGDEAAERAVGALFEGEPSCDRGCAEAWLARFLERAWRRPIEDAERARYAAALDDERAGSTLAERLRAAASAALSSPHFLYRRELGGDDPSRLGEYEIASRLSFLVWSSGPDDRLLEAARRGELSDPEVRRAELSRMWGDERARRGVRAFVTDWMAAWDEAVSAKDDAVLEGTPRDLARRVERSFELSVDAELWSGGGDARLTDLLVMPSYEVDDAIAALIGMPGAGGGPDGYAPASPPASERLGLLTHPWVLAAHTKESGASPFPIGEFLYENVLCESIPTAPPDLPSVSEDELGPDVTLREHLEGLTKAEACVGCHTMIGPPGFAFLPFDPIGRYSPTDARGRPYDTAGSAPIGGEQVAFGDVTELARALADHPATGACLARRLFRWTHGRFETDDDAALITALSATAVAERGSARALIEALVTDDSFLSIRRAEADQ